MRQIGTIPSEQNPRKFKDYLATRGMKTMIEDDSDGWAVWIYDEDHVEEAKKELSEFVEDPHAERYEGAHEEASRMRKEAEKEAEKQRKNMIDVRSRWERPFAARCPVVFFLMMASIAVALASGLGQNYEPVLSKLTIAQYNMEGIYQSGLQEVQEGQIWRLVTPIFVHFGPLHIIFNMYMLYQLGKAVEFGKGSWMMASFVILMAVASNLGQYWWTGPRFGGMSGVVYGLFGYIWMKSRFEPESGFFMHPNLVFWLIGWFFLGFTEVLGNIANMAHGVGLAVGMILGAGPSVLRELVRR